MVGLVPEEESNRHIRDLPRPNCTRYFEPRKAAIAAPQRWKPRYTTSSSERHTGSFEKEAYSQCQNHGGDSGH